MRHVKRVAAVFLFCSLLICTPNIGSCDESTSEMVRFKWAFVHQPAGSTEEKVIDFKAPPTVHSGDRLRIYLHPLGQTHLYLFLLDSQKGLTPLFPQLPGFYAGSAGSSERAFFIPDEMSWFQLDDSKGIEKFYLLASPERLIGLENLVKEYLDQPEDGEQKARVLEEIKRIRKEHSTLTSVAEKGVPIAGTISKRGGPISVVSLASLVEAQGFYGKTIRLRHE